MGRIANYPSTPATNAYNNLRGAGSYHPLSVETFGDWSVEAGDKVTVSRGTESYTSPVHEATLIWRGQPELELVSNGSQTRDPIGKMEVKKYSGGRSGLRDSYRLYNFEVNQRHLLYDVYNDYYGRLHAAIEVTSSKMWVKMEDWYNGLMGYLEMTASHLLVQFWGLYDGLSSEFELTRSRLYVDFIGMYDGLKSELEITRSRLYVEFIGLYDGLSSYTEQTRSRLYHRFDDAYNGLWSEFELTASRLYLGFHGLYDGLSSELELTRSRLYLAFDGLYDGLHGELEMTRSRFRLEFSGLYDGLSSELELTRSRFHLEFNGLYDGLHSELELTRSRLSIQLQGLYDGLNSQLELTRSRLSVEFHGLYDGLNSQLELTRSRLSVEFHGLYDGLNSQLELTRSRLSVEFNGLYDGLNSQLELTRSRLSVEFHGLYDGLNSQLELTRSRLSVEFHGLYDGLNSQLEVTASHMRTEYTDDVNSVRSAITQEASRISLVVEGTGENAHIKPASIVAAVNDGASSLKFSADHIDIDGIVSKLAALDVRVQGLTVDGEAVFDDSITANSIEADYIAVDGEMLNVADITINGNVMTITYVDGTTQDFSKATPINSLTGSWSGSALTVRTSPDTGKTYTSNISWQFFTGQGGPGETLYYLASYHQDQSEEAASVITGSSKRVQMVKDNNNLIRMQQFTGTTPSYVNNSPFYDISTDIANAKAEVSVTLALPSYSSGYAFTPRKDGTAVSAQTKYVKFGSSASTADTIYLEVMRNTDSSQGGGSATYNQSTKKYSVPVAIFEKNTSSSDPDSARRNQSIEVDGTAAFNNGWNVARDTVSYPSAIASTTYNSPNISIQKPSSTVGSSTPESITYTISAKAIQASGGGSYFPVVELAGNGNVVARQSFTITADANAMVYNSTTHKYSTRGFAKIGSNTVATGDLVYSGEEAYWQGWDAVGFRATNPVVWSNGAITNTSTVRTENTVYTYLADTSGGSTRYGSIPLRLSVGSGVASVSWDVDGKKYLQATYTQGYTNVTSNFKASGGKYYVVSNSSDTEISGSSKEYHLHIDSPTSRSAYVRTYTGSSGNTLISNGAICDLSGYWDTARTNGWSSAYNKISLPTTTGSNAYITIETPKDSPNDTPNSRQYTMSDYGNDAVRLKTVVNSSEVTVALYTHNKYTAGWGAAFGKMALPDVGTSASMTVKYPPSTVDGAQQSQSYYLDSDNTYVYIKANVGGTVYTIARDTNKKTETEGWNNACSKLSFPTSSGADNTSSINITYPKSTSGTVFSGETVRYTMELGSGNDAGYVVLNHYNPNVVPVTFVQKVARIELSNPSFSQIGTTPVGSGTTGLPSGTKHSGISNLAQARRSWGITGDYLYVRLYINGKYHVFYG